MDATAQSSESVIDVSRRSQPGIAEHLESSTPPTHPETIFGGIYNYPWAHDSDFQSGLSSILGATEPPASEGLVYRDGEVLLQAQCFYFARKHNLSRPVDVGAYRSWINRQSSGRPGDQPANADFHELLHEEPYIRPSLDNTITAPQPQVNGTSSLETLAISQPPQAQPPPYPTSFSAIVDLITRNEPIPGIEEIPSTVLDASLSAPNKTPKRRKPWETEGYTEDDSGTVTADRKGETESGEGAHSATSNWMQAIERGNQGVTKTEAEADSESAAENKKSSEEQQSRDAAGTNAKQGSTS